MVGLKECHLQAPFAEPNIQFGQTTVPSSTN